MKVIEGDCIEAMREMDEASVDAVVYDPPYNLTFMSKGWDRFDGKEDAASGYWIAGLIDGEGHFGIKRHTRGTHAPTFQLKLRADEQGGLTRARRAVGGVGTLRIEKRDGANDMVVWTVGDQEGCQRLVDLLDKYPLRLKKRNDYLVWREAVCEWTSRPKGNRWHGPADNGRMASLREQLTGLRSYREPVWSGDPFQDWCRLWTEQALRILKPGGHLLAFGGTRTYHRLACAIEDAGFEIRDSLIWLYGSGFPKSLDVSKAIDKAAGTEREVVGRNPNHRDSEAARVKNEQWNAAVLSSDVTAPATPEAQRWQGWGTALKPAHEPIVVARKPLAGTISANVLAHGTGALNVDGCRIGTSKDVPASPSNTDSELTYGDYGTGEGRFGTGFDADTGRWPANVVLAEEAAAELDGQTADLRAPGNMRESQRNGIGYQGGSDGGGTAREVSYGDAGGASRFFYVAKSSRAERNAGLDDRPACETCSRWVNEDQPALTPAAPDTQRPRAITESGMSSSGDNDSPTLSSGSASTDRFLSASRSTTATRTSRTTGSKTSNSSPPLSTSESTPCTSDELVTAGSGDAPSAASGSQPTPSTSTSASKVGSFTDDVDPATSGSSSDPSSSAGSASDSCPRCGGVIGGALRNAHPT